MTRLSNRDVDDLVQAEYEEALARGEQWAEESYEVRRQEAQRRAESAERP